MTDEVDASRAFYSRLFGWELENMPMEQGDYWVVKVGGQGVGGIMQKPAQAAGAPNYWATYVSVDDVDRVADTVKELGGQVIVPPTDIPGIGRFTAFVDPHGAVLSAITYVEERQ
ncbi:MAG: VOC family protein [Deltaproteobacteria bacterium]|nr:VOC family protein [Deltaproteobacteria bacterium]